VSDCGLTLDEQLLNYTIARTSNIQCDDDDEVRFVSDEHA
jgi:hypothetical protein